MSPAIRPVTPGVSEWAITRVGGGEWSVGGVGESGAASKVGTPDPTGGFGSMLSDAIGSLEHTQNVAAEQSRALATGETQDITSVVTAVQEAASRCSLLRRSATRPSKPIPRSSTPKSDPWRPLAQS